jgi:hypothetical protein
MSVRAGAYAVDGQKVSASDVARARVTESERLDGTAPAVWAVASAAVDAEECRMFLDMLGLDAAAVANARRAQDQSLRSARRGHVASVHRRH